MTQTNLLPEQGLLEAMLAARNEVQAARMAAYMRDQFPFLGIQSHQRKEVSRPFLAALKRERKINWRFIDALFEQPWRECQYTAIDYLTLMKAYVTPEMLEPIRRLIQTRSWWDTVDAFHSAIGNAVIRFPELKSLMRAWSTDEDFWLRRSAIIHQLSLKSRTDADLLEEILLNNLTQTEFFIAKAVGWSLREYSKTDRAWVSAFMARNSGDMVPLSVREASKYL